MSNGNYGSVGLSARLRSLFVQCHFQQPRESPTFLEQLKYARMLSNSLGQNPRFKLADFESDPYKSWTSAVFLNGNGDHSGHVARA